MAIYIVSFPIKSCDFPYVSLPEGKHCEYLWFFSNLAWIKGCHPAWSNDKPTLGRQWALRPEHDKFFGRWEDGYGLPLVYHWFYHMTSLKLRDQSQPQMSGVGCSRPGCLFHHAEVATAGGTMNTGSWGHPRHLRHPRHPRSERKTSQAVATDDIHEISAFLVRNAFGATARRFSKVETHSACVVGKKRRAARCMQYYVDVWL